VRINSIAGLVLAALLVLGISTISPAQPVRVIKVSMVSFKFIPNIIAFNEGDRVVLQLENNDDKPRPHSIASPYFSTVDVTTRGDVKPGVAKDGWKYYMLEPGTKGEIEFIAHGRGQFSFICALYTHASAGQTGAFIAWPTGSTLKQ